MKFGIFMYMHAKNVSKSEFVQKISNKNMFHSCDKTLLCSHFLLRTFFDIFSWAIFKFLHQNENMID